MRGDGAGGAAAHLERDEGGNREHQENGERDEEAGFHGEDRGGEHAGDGEDAEEGVVAIGARGIEAHERSEKQQVDGGEQRGVERWVRRVIGEAAREEEKIEREEEEVGEDEFGGEADGNFWPAPAPEPVALVEQRDGRDGEGDDVELAGGDDGHDAGGDEEEERDFEVALDGGDGRLGAGLRDGCARG